MNEKEFKADHFKNIEELIQHCKMWINDDDYDAYCRFFDMGAMEELIKELDKEKEKNKELEERLRKANEYIRNEMYIDDNPTICGDEEDTITELPISLNLYNEGLRELLELLEERN